MGSAFYYMKARFPSQKEAEERKVEIEAFFQATMDAHDYWQKHRDMEREGKRAEFWEGMKQFKEVEPYLRFIEKWGGDCNNDLAGLMDFGCDFCGMFTGDGVLWYSAEVWHFADWNGMATYLEERYGAEKVVWLSDEYIDPYELLEV